MRFTGALRRVNAALHNIVYFPDTDWSTGGLSYDDIHDRKMEGVQTH